MISKYSSHFSAVLVQKEFRKLRGLCMIPLELNI